MSKTDKTDNGATIPDETPVPDAAARLILSPPAMDNVLDILDLVATLEVVATLEASGRHVRAYSPDTMRATLADLDRRYPPPAEKVEDFRLSVFEVLAGALSLHPAEFVTVGPDIVRLVRQAQELAGLPEVSDCTKALARRWDYLAIENNVARSALSLVRVDDVRLPGKLATSAHKYIISLFAKKYVENGCPWSGEAEVTFGEIDDILGASRSGTQYARVRDLLDDLGGAGIGGEWISGGDTTKAWFGIFYGRVVTTAGEGRALAYFSPPFQASIRRGRWTYINPADARRLRLANPRSDTPRLLWLWLMTQRLPWPNGWPVFRAPEGATDGPENTRPLSEILGLYDKNRRKTVARIRAAAKVVTRTFPEYMITVDPEKTATMYRLFATRQRAVGAPRDNSDVCEDGTTPCANPQSGEVVARQGIETILDWDVSDFGPGVAPDPPSPPRDNAQTLTAWYVDCYAELGRTPPTARLKGQEAKEIAEQLALGAKPATLRKAIRMQVEENKAPSILALKVGDVERGPRGRANPNRVPDNVAAALAIVAECEEEEAELRRKTPPMTPTSPPAVCQEGTAPCAKRVQGGVPRGYSPVCEEGTATASKPAQTAESEPSQSYSSILTPSLNRLLK